MTTAVKPIAPKTQSDRFAALMLLVATICWGAGFTWAKVGGESLNRSAGAGDQNPLGPILLLGVRFTCAGILWIAIFPAARRGWSWASVGRAMLLGLMLATGLMIQHLGLDRTSEAVSAFLTSTTIVWVPVLATIVLRKPPAWTAWIAIVFVAAGVWLMTGGARGAHAGLGEILGLTCALIFSIHMLATNAIVPRDNAFRMTGGQFIVVGVCALCTAAVLRHSATVFSPLTIAHWFSPRDIWLNFILMITFPTLIAFGSANFFQPRLDPTRAIIIYMLEPIFASLYAFIFVGRGMTGVQIIGAAMILVANALVELFDAWRRGKKRVDLAPREVV